MISSRTARPREVILTPWAADWIDTSLGAQLVRSVRVNMSPMSPMNFVFNLIPPLLLLQPQL